VLLLNEFRNSILAGTSFLLQRGNCVFDHLFIRRMSWRITRPGNLLRFGFLRLLGLGFRFGLLLLLRLQIWAPPSPPAETRWQQAPAWGPQQQWVLLLPLKLLGLWLGLNWEEELGSVRES